MVPTLLYTTYKPSCQYQKAWFRLFITLANLTVSTISDLYAKNVECYFWNETEGKRGADEIGSCVLNYIKLLVEKINKPDIDIIFYSDNCCGQQKNKYLLAAYAYALPKFNVRSIEHKFLICGHSQNEVDNVHSVIEKQMKRHLKSGPIYMPDQYATLLRTDKKNGPPYQVHELTYEDFRFEGLTGRMGQ